MTVPLTLSPKSPLTTFILTNPHLHHGSDGETWTDETGDYTSMSGGIAQWYHNTLYISSLGQGISAKTFDEN